MPSFTNIFCAPSPMSSYNQKGYRLSFIQVFLQTGRLEALLVLYSFSCRSVGIHHFVSFLFTWCLFSNLLNIAHQSSAFHIPFSDCLSARGHPEKADMEVKAILSSLEGDVSSSSPLLLRMRAVLTQRRHRRPFLLLLFQLFLFVFNAGEAIANFTTVSVSYSETAQTALVCSLQDIVIVRI